MAKKKLEAKSGTMVVKVWPVLINAVETGVSYGLKRAHKHTSEPSEDTIIQAIVDAVTNEISDAFWFPEDQ